MWSSFGDPRGAGAQSSRKRSLRVAPLLDGRNVTDAEFDAYLSGLLSCAEPLRALIPGGRRSYGHEPSTEMSIAAE
jgi:hypothetical protein